MGGGEHLHGFLRSELQGCRITHANSLTAGLFLDQNQYIYFLFLDVLYIACLILKVRDRYTYSVPKWKGKI